MPVISLRLRRITDAYDGAVTWGSWPRTAVPVALAVAGTVLSVVTMSGGLVRLLGDALILYWAAWGIAWSVWLLMNARSRWVVPANAGIGFIASLLVISSPASGWVYWPSGLAIGWLVLGVAWCIALSAELRRDVDAPFLPMLTAVLIPVIAVGALVLGYVSEVPLIARFHLSEPSMNTIADELADAGGNGVSTVTSRTCVPFYCFSKVTRQGDRVEFSFASRLWEDTPGQFIRVDPAEGRVAPGDNSIDLGSGWYYVRPLLI